MRKNVRTTWLVLALAGITCLFLSGCDQRELMRKMTPTEDYMLARVFVTQVLTGDTASAAQSLSAQIKVDEARKGLEELTALFKHGEIKSVETVGVFFRSTLGGGQSGKTTQLTLQLELSTGWFVGTVVTMNEAGTLKIASANFESIPDSLEKMNALNLLDKPLWAPLFLLFNIAVPLFSVYALVVCIRTRLKRKWRWILFILLGVTTLRLNWSTGEMGFQLLSVQLLGGSFFRSGFVGPWIFGVSFPLGAVMFLIKRRRLMEQEAGDSGQPVNDLPTNGQDDPGTKADDHDHA